MGGEKWRVDASRLEESGWDLKVTGSLLVMPTWSHCASREEIGSVKLRRKSRCLLSPHRIEGAGNMEIDKVMDHFVVSESPASNVDMLRFSRILDPGHTRRVRCEVSLVKVQKWKTEQTADKHQEQAEEPWAFKER